MAGRRRLQRQSDKSRPVVTDDFIYDDPDNAKTSVPVNEPISDTPEEAIRKLRRRDPDYESESDHDKQPEDSLSGEESSSSASTVYSSGIMLDENLVPRSLNREQLERLLTDGTISGEYQHAVSKFLLESHLS